MYCCLSGVALYHSVALCRLYACIEVVLIFFRQAGETMQILEEKAQRHYESRLKSKVLQEWADTAASEKVARWHRERQAKEHNVM